MTTKSLFLSLSCALALSAAPKLAHADDDGDGEVSVNCGEQSPAVTKAAIVKELRKLKDKKSSCAGIDLSTVKLVGGLTPCSGKVECDPAKNFTQKFEAKGQAGNADRTGNANVDWYVSRAGFTESCDTSIANCDRK